MSSLKVFKKNTNTGARPTKSSGKVSLGGTGKLRVTGGAARGVQLRVMDSPGLRPATDRGREAVFSSLGDLVIGARCLDLFAGTGAYGLEALSRGAGSVFFVESNRKVVELLRENLERVAQSMRSAGDRLLGPVPSLGQSGILPLDARRFVLEGSPGHKVGDEPFDLVFADPPYRDAHLHLKWMAELVPGLLVEGRHSRFILELPGELQATISGLEMARSFGGRSPGDPCIRLYSRAY